MKSEPDVYKPAEACKIAEVAPYVLRYWETEFPALSEGKDKGAARLYTGRDVRIIGRIRELLYDEGFTVAGAKKRLEAEIAEGRFDESGKSTLPRPQQKKPSAPPPAAAAMESPDAVFLDEPLARAGKHSAATGRKEASPPEFPDRKRVLKELKEIARLLDNPRRSH